MDTTNTEAWVGAAVAAAVAAASAKESADTLFYITMSTLIILLGGVIVGCFMLAKLRALEQLIKLGLVDGDITIKPLEIKIEKKGEAK